MAEKTQRDSEPTRAGHRRSPAFYIVLFLGIALLAFMIVYLTGCSTSRAVNPYEPNTVEARLWEIERELESQREDRILQRMQHDQMQWDVEQVRQKQYYEDLRNIMDGR